MLTKIPTGKHCEERSVFRKRIPNNGTRTFELGREARGNILTWVIVCLIHHDEIDSLLPDISAFGRLPILTAVCRLGSDHHPDTSRNLENSKNVFHEAYYEIENVFLKHTEDGVKNLYFSKTIFKKVKNFMYLSLATKKIKLQPN